MSTAFVVSAVALAAASVVGLLTAADVALGVGLFVACCYAPLVLVDLPLGLALWVGFVFIEHLPAVSVGPTVAAILVALAWFGTLGARREAIDAIVKRHRRMFAAAIVLLVWLSMSALWARDAGLVGSDVWTWYVSIFTLVIVATTIATPGQVRLVLAAFVGGAVVSVVIGLLASGLTSDGTAIDSATSVDGRLQGGGGDPNYLAAGLVPAIVLAGALMGQFRDPVIRWLLCVAIVISGVGLAATQSRGGLIAAALTVIAALACYRRRAGTAVVLGLIVVALGAWFSVNPQAWNRITDFDDGGTGRGDLWAVGWEIFQDHPVHGAGLNNFRAESFRYVRRPGELKRVDLIAERPDIVHNTYLQLLVETGLVGLVLFMALILACLRAGWSAARRFDVAGQRALSDLTRAIIVASIGMLAASFFISNGTDSRLWVLLALGPGLLGIAVRQGGGESPTPAV